MRTLQKRSLLMLVTIYGVIAKKERKMKIGMPEALTVSSAVLFVGGQVIPGWTFFSLGILGAIMRLGLEQQAKQEKAKAIDDTAKSINDAGEAIGKFISALANSDSNNKSVH